MRRNLWQTIVGLPPRDISLIYDLNYPATGEIQEFLTFHWAIYLTNKLSYGKKNESKEEKKEKEDSGKQRLLDHSSLLLDSKRVVFAPMTNPPIYDLLFNSDKLDSTDKAKVNKYQETMLSVAQKK